MKAIEKFLCITFVCLLSMASCNKGGESTGGSDSVGQGGSMARFTINGDYIYTVDHSTLKLFDISNPAQPDYLDRKDQILRIGIETIFSMDTLLFIGSQDGMYIFDISRPEFPIQLSNVSHIRRCDPVVASGSYAYVTLNSQQVRCGNTSNVLNIYDISDLRRPALIATENLNFPKGLGVDGNKLFVCDDRLGVKVYDVGDPYHPLWIDDWAHQPETAGVKAYDVIPAGGLLLVTTDGGLYQFDYTGEKLRFVSKITVVNQ